MRRHLLILGLISSGCGAVLSNGIFLDDLLFLDALPDTARHGIDPIPTSTAKVPAPAGDTDLLNLTTEVIDSVDGFIAVLLEGVEEIRSEAPSSRDTDARTWGPVAWPGFPDTRIVADIQRTGDDRYAWVFATSTQDGDPIDDYLWGVHYAGTTVADGDGEFTFDYAVAGAALTKPWEGQLHVEYDFRDGRELLVRLDGVIGPGEVPGRTAACWFREQEGNGDFEYQTDADLGGGSDQEEITVRTRWLSDGSGRGDAVVTGGDTNVPILATQCWSATGALVYQSATDDWIDPIGDPTDCAFDDFAEVTHL